MATLAESTFVEPQLTSAPMLQYQLLLQSLLLPLLSTQTEHLPQDFLAASDDALNAVDSENFLQMTSLANQLAVIHINQLVMEMLGRNDSQRVVAEEEKEKEKEKEDGEQQRQLLSLLADGFQTLSKEVREVKAALNSGTSSSAPTSSSATTTTTSAPTTAPPPPAAYDVEGAVRAAVEAAVPGVVERVVAAQREALDQLLSQQFQAHCFPEKTVEKGIQVTNQLLQDYAFNNSLILQDLDDALISALAPTHQQHQLEVVEAVQEAVKEAMPEVVQVVQAQSEVITELQKAVEEISGQFNVSTVIKALDASQPPPNHPPDRSCTDLLQLGQATAQDVLRLQTDLTNLTQDAKNQIHVLDKLQTMEEEEQARLDSLENLVGHSLEELVALKEEVENQQVEVIDLKGMEEDERSHLHNLTQMVRQLQDDLTNLTVMGMQQPVDDTAVDEADTCPENYIRSGEECFYVSEPQQRMTWQMATVFCNGTLGALAQPTDVLGLAVFLRQHIEGSTEALWMGAKRAEISANRPRRRCNSESAEVDQVYVPPAQWEGTGEEVQEGWLRGIGVTWPIYTNATCLTLSTRGIDAAGCHEARRFLCQYPSPTADGGR